MAIRSSQPSSINDRLGYQRHVAIMQAPPVPAVFSWLDQQDVSSIWTTTVSVLEIQYGIDILPEGKRKRLLQEDFSRVLSDDLEGRVLGFELDQAIEASRIGALMRSQGRPPDHDLRDVMIASIASMNHATLATRNIKHFEGTGVRLVNPWA